MEKLNDILESKDSQKIRNFAKETNGEDFVKLKEALFKTKDAYCIAQFCFDHKEKAGMLQKCDIRQAIRITFEVKSTLDIRVFNMILTSLDRIEKSL